MHYSIYHALSGGTLRRYIGTYEEAKKIADGYKEQTGNDYIVKSVKTVYTTKDFES